MGTVDCTNLPDLVLENTFSFLEPKDFLTAGAVCRNWRAVQRTESVWKAQCLAILNRQNIEHPSWRDQFFLLRNWAQGRAFLKTVKSHHLDNENLDFTLLDENTAFEVYPDQTNPSLFHVHSLLSNEMNRTILIPSLPCAWHLHGTTLTVLDREGYISCFDIRTGAAFRRLEGDPLDEHSRSAHIYSTDQEIITSYNDQICIWNGDALSQTIEDVPSNPILKLCATTNFVYGFANCTDYGGEAYRPFGISRRDPTYRVHFSETDKPVCCMAASGSHVAIRLKNKPVVVFQEDSDGHISVAHTLEFLPTKASGQMHIYRNWLCVNISGVLGARNSLP